MLLPQELLDAIIDEVTDEASLKICSLASKSLLVRSQRFLFRSLYLYTSVNLAHHASSTCDRACTLFSSSPHLAGYVESLTLCVKRADNYASVEHILDILHLIRRLGIHGSSDGFRWDYMSPNLISAILRAVQLPSLQCFSLKRVISIPSPLLFYAASAFRVLSLGQIEILETGNPHPIPMSLPKLPFPSRLEQLSIPAAFRSDAVCTFLLQVNSQQSLLHLRSLAWQIYGSPSQYWERLLREATFLSTLEHLELWFSIRTSFNS